MKTKVILQGKKLNPDHVSVIRACLLLSINQYSKLLFRTLPAKDDPFALRRRRTFEILDAIDGNPYLAVADWSEDFNISINDLQLDKVDAFLLCENLVMRLQGSPSEFSLGVTGFSQKHFMNLLEEIATPLVPLIPKDEEDDEPIPN